MARTNIDLDERLVTIVMDRYNLSTKRSAVDFALRQLVTEPMTREEVLAMRGSGIEFANDELEGDEAPAE
ncbi:type II toxin-antitoxin system VapB family antitoxin [Microbacterium sp.]|uniref:type II toxin-antitoxin system VapB family antitoxin n=1 Tax=Microbacterium sp. TaxID=51671 RepID=UPI003C789173